MWDKIGAFSTGNYWYFLLKILRVVVTFSILMFILTSVVVFPVEDIKEHPLTLDRPGILVKFCQNYSNQIFILNKLTFFYLEIFLFCTF